MGRRVKKTENVGQVPVFSEAQLRELQRILEMRMAIHAKIRHSETPNMPSLFDRKTPTPTPMQSVGVASSMNYVKSAVKHAMRHMIGITYHENDISNELIISVRFKNRIDIGVSFTDSTIVVSFIRRDGVPVTEVFRDVGQAIASIVSITMFYCLR